MPDDLTIVAQYAKSNRDTPSEVYNAACRLLDRLTAAHHADDCHLSTHRTGSCDCGADVIGLEPPEKGAESNRAGRTPQTLGTAGQDGAREAQEAAKACEGFHWIGQSFATCDNCGRPAWEHKGHHVPGGLFTGEGPRIEEFKPGEADAIRAKWGSRP